MSQLLSVMASYIGGNQTRNISAMNTKKSNTDDVESFQVRIDLESVHAFDELVSSLEWYERQRKLFDQAAFDRFDKQTGCSPSVSTNGTIFPDSR